MTRSYAYIGKGYELDADAAWDYIRDGYLLAPRTVLKGRTKRPRSELPSISLDPKEIPFKVQETLAASMGKMSGIPRAVMFSGGFDSMLIACMARQCGAQVTAVTVQFEDFNLLTVQGAAEAANKAGFAHHILYVKAVEFLSAFEALTAITHEPVLDLDLAIVHAALKKYDQQIAGNVFISGMGSDQWFGNEALEAKRGNLDVRLDWAMVDEDAHHRVGHVYGYKFLFPFLSGPMLALSQSIPAEMKKDKKLLRALAIANTIPHRGTRSEIQVSPFMKHILIKTYGDRAWPCPVSADRNQGSDIDQTLRQIILGLWLNKYLTK